MMRLLRIDVVGSTFSHVYTIIHLNFGFSFYGVGMSKYRSVWLGLMQSIFT